ncbi:MAG: hypothetical protein JXO44_09560, partial [Clostridia bacterium]|nr:hypothetical protein [Clostridia bacterium]
MKFIKVLLTTTLAIALLGTGCSSQPQEVPSKISIETPSSPIVIEQSFLDTALDLLGQTHEASNDYFDNGQELLSADGIYRIGRSYPVNAFGIDTTLYTSINSQDMVNSISVHLGEDNFETMKDEITALLGEPSAVSDRPSEAGYTHVMWAVSSKYVYLYKGYGTVDLQLILPDQPKTSILDETFTSQLPDTITPVLSESQPYPALRDFIIKTYEIPEEYYASTKYYYNYVDFNDDGRKEILAVVMGPYTSGTGGSSALIAFEFEGEINEITELTLIHTPIIISNHATKGMKDMVVMRSGGGAEPAFIKLTSTGEGNYTSVNDGQIIDSLADISGQAIIANDLLADIDNMTYLTLE